MKNQTKNEPYSVQNIATGKSDCGVGHVTGSEEKSGAISVSRNK